MNSYQLIQLLETFSYLFPYFFRGLFSPHSKAKVNYKSTNLRKIVCGISDVATASVHSEKTWAKNWIMIIIISMNKSQELTFFHGRLKLTFAMKLKPEK